MIKVYQRGNNSNDQQHLEELSSYIGCILFKIVDLEEFPRLTPEVPSGLISPLFNLLRTAAVS